jgi:hypothetical protein
VPPDARVARVRRRARHVSGVVFWFLVCLCVRVCCRRPPGDKRPARECLCWCASAASASPRQAPATGPHSPFLKQSRHTRQPQPHTHPHTHTHHTHALIPNTLNTHQSSTRSLLCKPALCFWHPKHISILYFHPSHTLYLSSPLTIPSLPSHTFPFPLLGKSRTSRAGA